jgi:hypothetical protein
MIRDDYADRSVDDSGEILCTAPEPPPIAPSTCLASAMLDIGRTAGNALAREYSQHLPPALPPTA